MYNARMLFTEAAQSPGVAPGMPEKVWKALGDYADECLRMGRGLKVPKLGSFHAIKDHVRGKDRAFVVGTKFAKQYGVPLKKVGFDMLAPSLEFNGAKLAYKAGTDKDTGLLVLDSMVRALGAAVAAGKPIRLLLDPLGSLVVQRREVKFKFEGGDHTATLSGSAGLGGLTAGATGAWLDPPGHTGGAGLFAELRATTGRLSCTGTPGGGTERLDDDFAGTEEGDGDGDLLSSSGNSGRGLGSGLGSGRSRTLASAGAASMGASMGSSSMEGGQAWAGETGGGGGGLGHPVEASQQETGRASLSRSAAAAAAAAARRDKHTGRIGAAEMGLADSGEYLDLLGGLKQGGAALHPPQSKGKRTDVGASSISFGPPQEARGGDSARERPETLNVFPRFTPVDVVERHKQRSDQALVDHNLGKAFARVGQQVERHASLKRREDAEIENRKKLTQVLYLERRAAEQRRRDELVAFLGVQAAETRQKRAQERADSLAAQGMDPGRSYPVEPALDLGHEHALKQNLKAALDEQRQIQQLKQLLGKQQEMDRDRFIIDQVHREAAADYAAEVSKRQQQGALLADSWQQQRRLAASAKHVPHAL